MSYEVLSLSSKAVGTTSFAFTDLADAFSLGSELVRSPGRLKRTEFYLSFSKRINLEEMNTLKELASSGISIIWDPYVTRNVALIDGIQYALEKSRVRRMVSAGAYLNKLGFFNVKRAKVVRAQRLGNSSGFSALLILEGEEGTTLPLFVPMGMLPSGLRSRDTVEVAYLSVAGDRTVEGKPSPAEIYTEALAIELFRSTSNHEPLAWVSASEEIDQILSEFEQPPPGGGKKLESWQRSVRAAVTFSLRKELIYMEADDERHIHAEIGRRADAARKRPELQHSTRESTR